MRPWMIQPERDCHAIQNASPSLPEPSAGRNASTLAKKTTHAVVAARLFFFFFLFFQRERQDETPLSDGTPPGTTTTHSMPPSMLINTPMARQRRIHLGAVEPGSHSEPRPETQGCVRLIDLADPG